MLSINAVVDQQYDMFLTAKGTSINNEISIVNTYPAPWLQGSSIKQGTDLANTWAPSPANYGTGIVLPGLIETTEQYLEHLKNGTVAEVSKDLIGCFYQQEKLGDSSSVDALYPEQIANAWVGSSDNLYSFLVLNQRYPNANQQEALQARRGGNGNLYGAIAGASDTPARLINHYASDAAMEGLGRIVGFPFAGGPGVFPNPVMDLTGLSLAVLNRTESLFKEAYTVDQGTIIHGKLEYHVPTIRSLFEFTNDNAPGLQKLPLEVRNELETAYTQGFESNLTPITIYAQLSGIDNLEEVLDDANGHGTFLSSPNGAVPYDATIYTPNSTSPNFTTYKNYCESVGGYYPYAETVLGKKEIDNKVAIERFFLHADADITAFHNAAPGTSDYTTHLNNLVVGFRALMALSFDASPLWSSYGLGFSNAANPMIGKTYGELRNSPGLIQQFSGQEFQPQNIQLPSSCIRIGSAEPQGYTKEWPTNGWFDLMPTAIPQTPQDIASLTSESNYINAYDITVATTKKVYFPDDSLSSDTLTATSIISETLTGDDSVTSAGTTTTISSLPGLIHDAQILPNRFGTYISLGGGTDLVTGSPVTDVIRGPGHGVYHDSTFHGRLTVDAGAGDDVVAPGRGGSLIQLGTGKDSLIIDKGDLFGEANLLDFNGTDDHVFINQSFTIKPVDGVPNTVVITDPSTSETKTLRLTGSSQKVWNINRDFSRIIPTGEVYQSLKGGLDYVETHKWVLPMKNPKSFSADEYTITINPLPDVGSQPPDLSLYIGNQETVGKPDGYDIPINKNKSSGAWEANIDFSTLAHLSAVDAPEAIQFSLIPKDSASYGWRQIQVFISWDNGHVDTNTSDFSQIINTKNPTSLEHIKTKWMAFEEGTSGTFRVGYVGGLANLLLTNQWNTPVDIHGSPLAPRSNLKPIQITIDSNNPLTVELGPGSTNLSSRVTINDKIFSSWPEVRTFLQQPGLQTSHTIPTGLDSKYQTFSLSTDYKFVVNGGGLISGIETVEYYDTSHATLRSKSQTPYRYTNPFYMVDSDLLAISSVHSGADEFAVEVSSITAAWPARRGQGPVLLQDFNNISNVHHAHDGSLQLWTPNALFQEKFENSPVKIADYKQVGGWSDQTDGPKLASKGSYLIESFIHANDDSVKVQAKNFNAADITVLQGGIGNLVGFAYGFINGGIDESWVHNIYAHRLINDSSYNPWGLVSMRVGPSPYWLYDGVYGSSANESKEPVNVEALYVPQPTLAGIELNQVGNGAVLQISPTPRGFGPETSTLPLSTQTFNLTVSNINVYNDMYIVPKMAPSPNKVWLNGADNGGNGQITASEDSLHNWSWNPAVQFPLYKAASGGEVIVTSGAEINLNINSLSTVIDRPKLHRSSKIILRGKNGTMGPDPVTLTYSSLVGATVEDSVAGKTNTFVVSNVASGYVEKKRSDGSWVDVSTPPKTSNPRALLQLLQNRMITPSDEIRWVPGTANEGKASAEAFSLYGWDGVSTSVEASEIEVGVE